MELHRVACHKMWELNAKPVRTQYTQVLYAACQHNDSPIINYIVRTCYLSKQLARNICGCVQRLQKGVQQSVCCQQMQGIVWWSINPRVASILQLVLVYSYILYSIQKGAIPSCIYVHGSLAVIIATCLWRQYVAGADSVQAQGMVSIV